MANNRNWEDWLPMPAETFFIPLVLCYVIFFMLRDKTIWGALIAPCIVLALNITFVVNNFLIEDRNAFLLLRQSLVVILAFSPLLICCVKH